MNRPLRQAWMTTFGILTLAAVMGCQQGPAIRRAGRTTEARQQLIKPGLFGDNAPADRLRGRFDFWNEEIIREDVAVGTVFMGDSITELWQLDAYFAPNDGVILNRGIGGDIATHMARRFAADVIQLRPRNVVILAGTNDVSRMLSANQSDEEIIRAVTAAIGSMMDDARAAGIHTFVCSILPTNSDTKNHEGKARILPKINAQLKAACQTKGCIYVDYASHVADATGALRKDLSRDGLHPHYAGYEIMARCLQDAARAKGLRL
ncbi:MAG TPA: GDSL-type esterase/lipase family protein [Phycisphaerae bacterium]|nr:GDSL-type esterase/lipase family protein [Phycisphaerae bacterium]